MKTRSTLIYWFYIKGCLYWKANKFRNKIFDIKPSSCGKFSNSFTITQTRLADCFLNLLINPPHLLPCLAPQSPLSAKSPPNGEPQPAVSDAPPAPQQLGHLTREIVRELISKHLTKLRER